MAPAPVIYGRALMKTIPLILLSVALGAAGQLFLKQGMTQFGATSASAIWGQLLRIVTVPAIAIGFVAYLVSGILWLVVLSQVNVNWAFPWQALTYVLVLLGSWALFGEKINLPQLLGVALICLGVVAIARGK
jgi:multidrug transporter EmrE-like cation transporter